MGWNERYDFEKTAVNDPHLLHGLLNAGLDIYHGLKGYGHDLATAWGYALQNGDVPVGQRGPGYISPEAGHAAGMRVLTDTAAGALMGHTAWMLKKIRQRRREGNCSGCLEDRFAETLNGGQAPQVKWDWQESPHTCGK